MRNLLWTFRIFVIISNLAIISLVLISANPCFSWGLTQLFFFRNVIVSNNFVRQPLGLKSWSFSLFSHRFVLLLPGCLQFSRLLAHLQNLRDSSIFRLYVFPGINYDRQLGGGEFRLDAKLFSTSYYLDTAPNLYVDVALFWFLSGKIFLTEIAGLWARSWGGSFLTFFRPILDLFFNSWLELMC